MKNIFSFSTILLLVFISFACKKSEMPVEDEFQNTQKLYKSEKIGFFTDKMKLTEKEAIHFWPIYYSYENKRDSIWEARKTFFIQYKRDQLNPDNAALNQFLSFDRQLYKLKEETVYKLRPHLPDDKILLMFYTEQQFKHVIINRIRGRHNMMDRPGRGQGYGKHLPDGPQPPFQDPCPIN